MKNKAGHWKGTNQAEASQNKYIQIEKKAVKEVAIVEKDGNERHLKEIDPKSLQYTTNLSPSNDIFINFSNRENNQKFLKLNSLLSSFV
jgi:hypothetical protein